MKNDQQPRAGMRLCPQCGGRFVCGIAAGDDRCWCFDLPAVMPVRPDTACLCPNCLREAIEAKRKEQ
jgi:ribosomal protein L34E